MNLSEIKKAGGFVASRPVVKEIRFIGFDDAGNPEEFTASVGVRFLSYADFASLRREFAAFETSRNGEIETFRAMPDDEKKEMDEPSPPSWEMALVYGAARFGNRHQEALTMSAAHELQSGLATALFSAVLEENVAGKKKVNSGGRVLARDGAERDRGQNDSGSASKPVPAGSDGLDGVLPTSGNAEPEPQA